MVIDIFTRKYFLPIDETVQNDIEETRETLSMILSTLEFFQSSSIQQFDTGKFHNILHSWYDISALY